MSPTPPPEGFSAYGITVYPLSADAVFSFGHLPKKPFFAASNAWSRQVRGVRLLGPGDRWGKAAEQIVHAYARYTPPSYGAERDETFGLSLGDPGPDTLAITYLKPTEPTPVVPDGPYVRACQVASFGNLRAWHAVTQTDASQATLVNAAPPPLIAVCGAAVHLPRHQPGVFDRAVIPEWIDLEQLCPYCSWRVAFAIGAVDVELEAISHGGEIADGLTRIGHDPTLAARVCTAAINEHRRLYGEPADEDEHLIQVLATASLHAPKLAVPHDCAEGTCEHIGDHTDPGAGCDFPDVWSVCPTCTPRAGEWAGEWAGQYLKECQIAGPCQVLLTLADHYRVTAST
jgi:hypothetical protein